VNKLQVINLSLMESLLKKHRILFIVIAACVAAYSVMILGLWPLVNDESMMELMGQLSESIPGLDSSAFSMTLGQYIETQWLGIYWLPLAGSVLIAAAAKAIGGSVTDGSLEMFCASPLKRRTYLTTVILTLLIMSVVLSVATVVPLAALGTVFDAQLKWSTVVILLTAAFLVLFVFSLIVLAISAWTRGIGLACSIAVALILIMLVLYMATPYVEALEVLQPINLLHWWGAGGIIDEDTTKTGLWIWLGVVGVTSLTASFIGFLRRDLT
jgi:ABC-type transport system involved in multi-copper enzyme maturation permease subunit